MKGCNVPYQTTQVLSARWRLTYLSKVAEVRLLYTTMKPLELWLGYRDSSHGFQDVSLRCTQTGVRILCKYRGMRGPIFSCIVLTYVASLTHQRGLYDIFTSSTTWLPMLKGSHLDASGHIWSFEGMGYDSAENLPGRLWLSSSGLLLCNHGRQSLYARIQ